jgi:hypothetical protein
MMRVSLAPKHTRSLPPGTIGEAEPLPLLREDGAGVIIGGHIGVDGLATPIKPSAATLFGPRGACLASPDGPLFVSDTGHHRLLVWHRSPADDGVPADLIIGQPDFLHEGRNSGGDAAAATLNVPTGVAACDGVLAVADAWNHRVLLWIGYPDRSNRCADIVLGQSDFSGCFANRGGRVAGPDTLNWCYGVAVVGGGLIVADTGNRRVLIWEKIPTRNGAPADLVLGQYDFAARDENAGGSPGSIGMRWPHGVTIAAGMLLVADAGNNRVMVWQTLPRTNGAPCDFVLGQVRPSDVDNNRADYYPSTASLSMPYGLAAREDLLIVADTANSRLVGYDLNRLGMGAPAVRLAGQECFSNKGDNRWRAPARDSLCWPYGVATSGETLVIADSGNNRVLLWEIAA